MKKRELFPQIEPYKTGMLKVSDLHTVYYEEVGNPQGKPIVFLHGGPGAGLSAEDRRYFDPEFYRVILFDQRGAGKSTPHAELKENTTQYLVEDIEKIREHLNIDKWVVFGESWGTTLALTYAIHYPSKVMGLILRGIFLGTKAEIDWIYQEGASNIYPDKWEDYLQLIPEEERKNMIEAYYKRLTSSKEEEGLKAARSWSIWEGNIVNLIPDEEAIKEFGESGLALSMARTECHYFINNMFNESDNYILENAYKIKDIPSRLVHGRYDMNCRIYSAWKLHKLLSKSDLKIIKDAGHLDMKPDIVSELVEATENFKKLY